MATHPQAEFPAVEVFSKNLSCEPDRNRIIEYFASAGLDEESLKQLSYVLFSLSLKAFFQIFNQSGMDHELIGHIYNYLAGLPHGEEAVVKTQLLFAKKRRGFLFHRIDWIIANLIWPTLLYHHKKDEL